MGLFKKDSPRGFYTSTICYLHRGFFGLCPVYISNIETDIPHVRPRHWIFEILFYLTELFVFVCSLIFDLYLILTLQEQRSMMLPLFVTGRLDPPKEFEELP